MDKKYLLIIDSIVLIGSLLTVFFIVGYTQPFAVAELPGEKTNILFTFPSKDYVIIDTNSRFDSPETLFIDETISLLPGKYFIKFFNGNKNEIREISIDLSLDLKVVKVDDENLGFANVGESDLLINTYDIGSLVDSSVAFSGGSDE